MALGVPPVDGHDLDAFRTGKAYTAAEAARLAGTSPATIHRWLKGYDQPGHQMATVLGSHEPMPQGQVLRVSFLDLIEIVVVARFRQGSAEHQPVKLERLRRAHAYARHVLGIPYPFASLDMREAGGHLMHEFQQRDPGPGTLALDLGGQWVLPLLVREEVEENIDFNGHFAERWFPKGRAIPLVVDPRVAAGRMVVSGFGVTINTLHKRWQSGDPIRLLAADYGIDSAVVEEVLQMAA
jgi:uncharacterized protein (DUF433 family)